MDTDLDNIQFSDLEDVRIILKIKGKHYSIIQNEDSHRVTCMIERMVLAHTLLTQGNHSIITPSLEEIKDKNLLDV